MPASVRFVRVASALRRISWILLLLVGNLNRVLAHPMPSSAVLLDVQPGGVAAELQLPLSELQMAFGHDVNRDPTTLVARLGPQLRAYMRQHVQPIGPDGRAWSVAVRDLRVQAAEQTTIGSYQELTAHLWLQPPVGSSARTFTLNYDVIIHQLVTHKILVSVRQDWEAGLYAEQAPVEVGVIQLDVRSNTILPLRVMQAPGSLWTGFRGMVGLGLEHIAAGTDHLLFLLALLLPAPLLVRRGRWGAFGGVRYSLGLLLRIVTAFTLGHSLTLLAGALGWLHLPAQPVEVLIAVSILVSAGHALRPLFYGREAYVAAGFGLVHGLAFAGTLANLHLDAGRMALSIFGFNLGIELMQLLVIAFTIPWLLLLSRTPTYPAVRVGGGLFATAAAAAWLLERLLGRPSPLAVLVEQVASYAPWLLALLATGAVLSYWRLLRHQDQGKIPSKITA